MERLQLERLQSQPVEGLQARAAQRAGALFPSALFIVLITLFLSTPAEAAPGPPPQKWAPAELAAAAARLDAEESAHAADRLARELANEGYPGLDAVQSALALDAVGREAWPPAPERSAYGPGDAALAGLADLPQAELLAPGDPRTLALIDERADALDRRRLPVRYAYDDSARELVRLARVTDGSEPEAGEGARLLSGPAAVLLGAAYGYAPDTDAAEALLERELDTGAARAELAALERAWVDGDGRAHGGLSLLDALRGDEPLALRPLDLVGVVRAVDGPGAAAWPAPEDTLEALRARVAEIHARALNQRALRRNLARTALTGSPALDPAADGSLYRLHAVWRDAEGDPGRVAAGLPDAGDEAAWLAAWAERYRKQAVRKGAIRRSKTYQTHATAVQSTLEAILEEYGAFDRSATSLADAQGGPAPGVQPASNPANRPAPQPAQPAQPGAPAAPEPGAAEPGAVTPALHTPPKGPPPIAWEPAALPALRKSFEGLRKRKRKALLEDCIGAARASGALQVELVARWSAQLAEPADELPPPERFEAHDAKRYRGGPPRREIRKGNRHWESLRKLISDDNEWEATRAVHYAFASGHIARDTESKDDDWNTLALLLDGVLPDQGLAEAVLLRELDRGGPVRKEAEYFAHTYADRQARAYDGITLFDAWTADIELEIPDPDARAYAAKLWNDTSVPVPLSDADHALWYPRMELSLKRLRDHRDVSRSVAALWFQGRPELPGQYENSTDILQASIALAEQDPSELRSAIQEHGAGFPAQALERVKSEGDSGWNAGNARRDALIEGREAIRQAVLRVLQERDQLGD